MKLEKPESPNLIEKTLERNGQLQSNPARKPVANRLASPERSVQRYSFIIPYWKRGDSLAPTRSAMANVSA